jgi:hypothetical protein
VIRNDFAMPFAIDAGSGQAARAPYPDHVDQMIRQVLLTDPGERVCMPTFGAGLRRLIFAPISAQLGATTQMIVTQALTTWLGDQISVQKVTVETSADDPQAAAGFVMVTVVYTLLETQATRTTAVQVV